MVLKCVAFFEYVFKNVTSSFYYPHFGCCLRFMKFIRSTFTTTHFSTVQSEL